MVHSLLLSFHDIWIFGAIVFFLRLLNISDQEGPFRAIIIDFEIDLLILSADNTFYNLPF